MICEAVRLRRLTNCGWAHSMLQRLRYIHSGVRRDHFAQEPSVSESETARSIDPYNVLIVVPDLHNNPGFVPFFWMCAELILESDSVADLERPEFMRAIPQLLHLPDQPRLESVLLSPHSFCQDNKSSWTEWVSCINRKPFVSLSFIQLYILIIFYFCFSPFTL